MTPVPCPFAHTMLSAYRAVGIARLGRGGLCGRFG
jgi:hypothetical protein